MDDRRKQFTFYRSFWEAIKGQPKKDWLPILEAIISYGLDGDIPDNLSKSQSSFFSLIKPVLDSGRKKAASGKQGGSKPKANGKQTETEKEKEGEKEGEIEIEGEIDKKQSEIKERSFTLFWDGYPNKADRNDAWDVWESLDPDAETVGKIKAGLDVWKKSGQWLDDDGRYIPSAAKWLSKRRWECKPAPAKNPISAPVKRELDDYEIEAIRRLMEEET